MSTLTQAELKRQLRYDPETGVFTRVSTSNRRFRLGSVAGSTNADGYLSIMVLGSRHQAHRLAWLYVYGYFPEHQIDHRNGKRDDNRLENLRHVSQYCNMQNIKTNSRNTSGFPGVSWHKKTCRWRAIIMICKERIHIGSYTTTLEAALARYNFEVVDSRWTCNHRSKLAKAIKKAWPEFNPTL